MVLGPSSVTPTKRQQASSCPPSIDLRFGRESPEKIISMTTSNRSSHPHEALVPSVLPAEYVPSSRRQVDPGREHCRRVGAGGYARSVAGPGRGWTLGAA